MFDETTLKLLTQQGFPLVVCLWFMFRMEKRFDRLLELLVIVAKEQSQGNKEGG